MPVGAAISTGGGSMTSEESTRRRAETRVQSSILRTGDSGELEVIDWDLDVLERYMQCLVITYRKNGEPVSTPVWYAREGESVLMLTGKAAGKVKRLRNDPRVRLAPCSFGGKPRGPAMDGVARFLPESDFPAAEQALKDRYGLGRKLYYRFLGPDEVIYLEITAADGKDR
jgi:uncharacterized protein